MTEVEEKLPVFCEAINAALEGKVDGVLTTIKAFEPEEAELFYKAMEYAYNRGVPVTLAPSSDLQESLKN